MSWDEGDGNLGWWRFKFHVVINMSMHYDVFPQRFDFSWDFICQLKILAGKCKFHSLLSTWKMCSVQFFLEVWLVLGVIWSEFSMPVCFVPEIFSFPLSSNTLKKMSAEKAPKQETAQTPSPLPLGKTHVNRHVELIFCSRFLLKVRFFGVGEFSFNDSPSKAMELHRVVFV